VRRRLVAIGERVWRPLVSVAAVAVIGTMIFVVDATVDQRADSMEQADRIERVTRSTNRAVKLLDDRTPLFGELQATERRIECVSELNAAVLDALAEGLVAVVAEDEQALSVAAGRVAETRSRLSLLGTDRDPC